MIIVASTFEMPKAVGKLNLNQYDNIGMHILDNIKESKFHIQIAPMCL